MAEHGGEASFGDLSLDLLTEVVTRANPTVYELCMWATLSRRMKAACYSRKLWVKVEMTCHPRNNVYGVGLEAIAGRCVASEELILRGLNVLDRPNPWMHYGLERLLEKCGKASLRTLRLQFVSQLPFTDLLLTKIGTLCPLLEDFELSATNYFATDSAVAAFMRACPRILHFRCFVKEGGPLHALSDVTLWQIAKKWPNLQTLEINAHNMTENGLFGLEDCKRLERLGLHGYKRGVFDRAKVQDAESITDFPSMREVLFAHILPSMGELKRLIRMAPLLSFVELRPESSDERMQRHANNIATSLSREFPHLKILVSELLPDGVEPLTSAMLSMKLLARQEREREREREPFAEEEDLD